MKFPHYFWWFRIFPRRRGISLPKISTFLRDRVSFLFTLFPCTFSSEEYVVVIYLGIRHEQIQQLTSFLLEATKVPVKLEIIYDSKSSNLDESNF